jgi:hypothetical protein
MPYLTCPHCRITYYTAASWVHSPECPHCYESPDRPRQVLGKVVSLSRRRERGSKGDDPRKSRESG